MSVDIARMAAHLPPEEQQRVIRAYRQEAESETTAYLLCFFLGIFGAHRWYLGHWRSGLLHLIIPALVVLVVVAAVIELIPAIVAAIIVAILLAIALGWEIIDLFAIDDEVRAHNRELAERLVAGGALEDHTAFDQAVAKLDTLDRTQAAAAGGITAADVAGARALADEQGRVTSFDYYSAGDTQISAIPTQQQQQQQQRTAEQPGSNDWSFTETLPPEQPQTPAAPPAEDTTAPLGQMAAAAAGAGLAEDVLSFQHHETDYGTTESLEVDHVALPAEPGPGENDDTWPEMRIPPEAAMAASVAAFSQSGTDWTDAGASGDNLPVADVASWPDAVRVHLPEDAPNPSDPAATFTAAPVPEFAVAESDYTDAHPHVHHNMPIADIEPGVAKPLYVTLPDQDEDTTVVLVPDLSDTQPEQPDTNTDAYSWGIAGAAAPAGSSPSWEDTQPIPPEAFVPPTVPVTTTPPEPEQETLGELAPLAGAGAAAMLAGGGEPDTSEAAAPPEWPVAPAPEWPAEPAHAAEPAAPAAPAEAASEAAAAAPPQRMKRVRVVRRLVVDGEVVQEQVVEEIVPADTDTAATAEQLRESLGHATPEEIAQMAHLDPNTPLELRQKTELPDSGGTQQ